MCPHQTVQLIQIKSDNSLGPLTIRVNISAAALTLFSSIVEVLDHYPMHNSKCYVYNHTFSQGNSVRLQGHPRDSPKKIEIYRSRNSERSWKQIWV